MISKLLKMQLLEDDEELAYKASASSDKVKKEADGRPAWMRVVMNSMTTWLDMLPKVSFYCLVGFAFSLYLKKKSMSLIIVNIIVIAYKIS